MNDIEQQKDTIKNTINIRGRVRLIVQDSRTGELIPKECQDVHNIVTNNYTYLICEGIRTSTYVNITHCGVGSNNLPAQKDQGDLLLPISPRQPISDSLRVGTQIIFSTYFASTFNNGTWRECGMFTALTAGTMACRAIFPTPFEKTLDKTATIEWTISLFN